MLLIGLAAAVFVYYLTTPEQRGVTFWISAGFLIFALVFETLQIAGIAMRSNNGRNIPVNFSQVILGGVYFFFVIVMSVWNALSGFSTVKYVLIHIAGLVMFLVPMMLINMAALKLSSSESRQQSEGRANLASMANKIMYLADDLKRSGVPSERLSQLVNFSEKLRYSDPSPASGKLERELESAVKNLEALSGTQDFEAVIQACTLAERALTARNDYVRNSK